MPKSNNKFLYTTAIALAGFSGAVATYGLTKFAPGAEFVVGTMGVLFEVGKLTSLSLMHRPLPRSIKTGFIATSAVLMTLNVAGVSGMLSNAYSHRVIDRQASAHTTTADADLLQRQFSAAERQLSDANNALLRARDDKARQRAAKSAITAARSERDAITTKLAAAHVAESDNMRASGEFAAIKFVADATGSDQDKVAHVMIATISAIPEALAFLLMLAASYVAPKAKRAPAKRKPATKRKAPRPALSVVN
jgi:hypothetical protein